MEIRTALYDIQQSVGALLPELTLLGGLVILIICSFFRNAPRLLILGLASLIFIATIATLLLPDRSRQILFAGTLTQDSFSDFIKVILNLSGLFCCVMANGKGQVKQNLAEFVSILVAVILGSHFLLMSNNLLTAFLSLELVSIGSYILAGYNFNKKASEGGLKYFLFGSVASATMLYGFSILYGITGTLDFTSDAFADGILAAPPILILVAGSLSLVGFFFKISAVPMHAWAPDVYEAAPIPVIAFLSVVPKLAGVGILAKFVLSINVYGQTSNDWQLIIAGVALLTITVGNFAALSQRSPKRMMAYSSIAQSGFLLVGIAAFLPQGMQFLLFYAAVYTLMNFAVFTCLQYFEERNITTIADFAGTGKYTPLVSVMLIIGLIALTGLPPTSGFTGKLFLFSALWQSYEISGKALLLWLLIIGLLNTVVSLFYYLKIPYYAFLKKNKSAFMEAYPKAENNPLIQNLLGAILVLMILVLFFAPGLLMGWINKVNFVF